MPILKKMDKKWLNSVTDFDGKIYGIPECIEGLGIIVNKAMFEAVNVDVKSLYNWDGLLKGFETLKKAISEKNPGLMSKFPKLQSVMAVALAEAWIQGNHGFIPFINEDFYVENKQDPNYNPIHEAFKSTNYPGKGFANYKKYIDMLLSFAQPNAISANYDSIIDGGILIQTSAATQQGTWLEAKVKEFDKQNSTNMKNTLEMIPFVTPQNQKWVAYPGQFFGINKNISKEKYEAAEKFFEFFFSAEANDMYTNDLGFISPIEGANQNFKDGCTFNETIKKAIKEDKIISGDLSVIKTEALHKDTLGTSIQKYATSDLSDASFNKIVKEPFQTGWTDIATKQNIQISSKQNKK